MNDGTDAKNEMETWASPDTNRTDITTLLKKQIVMENELTNQSGIIKVEIRKGDKVSAAEIYVDKYLKLLEIHKGIGDTMIESVLNQLKD